MVVEQGSKVITDTARSLIGVEQEPAVVEVDKSALRKFARAIAWPDDPNPLYFDEQYASKSSFGGLIAAPTFCTSFPWLMGLLNLVNPSMGKYRVGLAGGNEYEMLEPVRPGDVLTAMPVLASLQEKPRDDGGVMLVIVLQASFYNQSNVHVLTATQTLLRIYGPENLQ